MTASRTRTAIWLRIFCAVLLLSLGFAHKPLYAQISPDPTSSSYLLPDGSFAGLCGDEAGQGKPGKTWLGCEACRLSSEVLLPTSPDDHPSVARTVRNATLFLPTVSLCRSHPRPGSPVRGPPSVFV